MGCPLAVLAAGNEDLFARAFGYPVQCASLVTAIVAGGVEWIDIGRAGQRFFSLMVGVGFDADVVHRLTRWRLRPRSLRRVTRWSYVRPILHAFRHQPWGQVSVTADGVEVRCRAWGTGRRRPTRLGRVRTAGSRRTRASCSRRLETICGTSSDATSHTAVPDASRSTGHHPCWFSSTGNRRDLRNRRDTAGAGSAGAIDHEQTTSHP
jgi:hypothetical protein